MDRVVDKTVTHRRLREILSIMAGQLSDLVQEGRSIENAVGDNLRAGPNNTLNPGIIDALQGLDRVVQVTDELSQILNGLVSQIDDSIQIEFDDAVDRFRLRALFFAFGANGVPDPTLEGSTQTGGVELF